MPLAGDHHIAGRRYRCRVLDGAIDGCEQVGQTRPRFRAHEERIAIPHPSFGFPQIPLGLHGQHGASGARSHRIERTHRVVRLIAAGQHHVGFGEIAVADLDAESFDRIVGVTQARGIHETKRRGPTIEQRFDRITGRAGYRGDDGARLPQQRIEQRRLAGIGRAASTTSAPSRTSAPLGAVRSNASRESQGFGRVGDAIVRSARRPLRGSRCRTRSALPDAPRPRAVRATAARVHRRAVPVPVPAWPRCGHR